VYHRYAEILAGHAATVFKTMSGLEPDTLEIVEDLENQGPKYNLGVRVDFKSLDEGCRVKSGFFICAFETIEAAGDIAAVIAKKLGVEMVLDSTVDSIDDVLGEFLNVAIGLTCSDWADQGINIEFSPPQKMSTWKPAPSASSTKAFHLTMETRGRPTVSIFLVFLPNA
jgi:hypothetical protein